MLQKPAATHAQTGAPSAVPGAAGIVIDYQVTVEADIPNVITQQLDGYNCGLPGPSGLIVFEELSGGGQRYCICAFAFCPEPSGEPVTIVQGVYPDTFA